MSELKDVITSYNSLSFSDRIVFYTTISNDIPLTDDIQSFLIETRLDGNSCIYCNGMHAGHTCYFITGKVKGYYDTD